MRRRWLECAAGLVGVGLALAAGVVAERASVAQTDPPPAPDAAAAGAAYSDVAYTLHAELDAVEHRVRGEGVIRWTNRSREPQKELWLHLYLNAFKNERTVFMRSPAGAGFRGGGLPDAWGYISVDRLYARELERDLWPDAELTPGDPLDETDARVPLPREVAPGETLTLEVRWLSVLPRVTHRTGYAGSFHMVAQWFPKLAVLEPDGRWSHFPFMRLSEFYADYGSYDVTIDAPAGFVVGATGKLHGHEPAGDRVAWRYRQDRVHDFAFAAWDGFDEKTAEADGVALRVLYPKGAEPLARIALAEAAFGLRWYGEAFGDYPYDTLTIVHPPMQARDAGGMEYPTLITTGGHWTEPLIGARSVEAVTLHELAHQWFYGLVGTNENAWAFLDEGITTWATMRAAEARHGAGAAFDGLGFAIDHAALVRMAAAEAWGHDEIAQPADAFATGSDYGRLVYSRTATLLETAARVWDAGALTAAVGAYARAHRFGHPTPADLIAAVRSGVGEDAAAMLERGLMHNGWVDLSVATFRSEPRQAPRGIFGDPDDPDPPPEADGAAYTGIITVRRRGDLVIPVEVEVRTEGGHVETLRWDGQGPHHTFAWSGDSPIEAVIVDPEHRVLIDQDLSNNVARRAPSRLAPRVLSHAAYLAHVLLELAAP